MPIQFSGDLSLPKTEPKKKVEPMQGGSSSFSSSPGPLDSSSRTSTASTPTGTYKPQYVSGTNFSVSRPGGFNDPGSGGITVPGAVPAGPMSVAPKPVVSPISTVSPVSPISTSAPAQQQQQQNKQKATELLASIDKPASVASNPTSTIPVPTPDPTNPEPTPKPPGYQESTGNADAAKFLTDEKSRNERAAAGTAGVQSELAKESSKGSTSTYDEGTGLWYDENGKAVTTGTTNYYGTTEGLTKAQIDAGITIDPETGETLRNGKFQGGEFMSMTPGQRKAVLQAAEDAKKPYDAAQDKLNKQSIQDQADSLIAAGQSGGFMNSQKSGKAAGEAGTAWTGVGGTLGRLKESYEKAAADLEAEKIKAVEYARNATNTAQRTGKQNDYDSAANAVRGISDLDRVQQTRSEAHLKNLQTLSAISKLERADATDTINNLVANGYDIDSLPQEYIDDIDSHLASSGMPPGSAKLLFAAQKKAFAAKELSNEQDRQKAEIDNAKSIVGLLKDVPQGQSINIGGNSYMGLEKGDYATGTETDDNGNVHFWSFDKSTGEVTTTSLGNIGTTKDGWETQIDDNGQPWRINSKTGQMLPFSASQTTTQMQTLVPDGTRVNPFRPGKTGVQCGEWQNDCNDPSIGRIWGDSLEQKLSVARGKNPKTGEDWSVTPDEAQVGDTVIAGGSWTGHVYRILDKKTAPNGKKQWLAFEANMVPPGGGAITSTRWVNADDKNNLAIARVPIRPEMMLGTDAKNPSQEDIEGSRMSAVQGLVSQGITDPKEIASILDEAAKASGYAGSDFTDSEISSYMNAKPTGTSPTFGNKNKSNMNELLSPSEAKELGVPYGTTRGKAASMGIVPGAATDKILSPSEAKTLGVPYGTTQSGAIKMGITPGQVKAASAGIETPSFEDFSKQASESAGMSLPPEQLEPLYKATVGAIPSYLDAAENLSYKFAGEKKGPAFIEDVTKALNNNDFLRAQDKLKKAALDTADTTTSQQVRGRDDAINAIKDIQKDLAAYQAKGGDTGIFKGKLEDLAGKAGRVSDPERRKLATKIAGTLANYRKAISGAAFTESEGKVYEAMFPSVMSGREMNEANMSGLLDLLNNSNATFYRQQIGNENYEAVFGH